jgi:hypothetical protein
MILSLSLNAEMCCGNENRNSVMKYFNLIQGIYVVRNK